jgi:hypothetical protein
MAGLDPAMTVGAGGATIREANFRWLALAVHNARIEHVTPFPVAAILWRRAFRPIGGLAGSP